MKTVYVVVIDLKEGLQVDTFKSLEGARRWMKKISKEIWPDDRFYWDEHGDDGTWHLHSDEVEEGIMVIHPKPLRA